jgi:small subunit ribosomal protein S11
MAEEKVKKEESREAEIKETDESQKVSDTKNAIPDEDSKKKKSKKIKKQILKGKASIKCTYNNTMVSVSDLNGNILGWATSGLLGFKGAKKATPYAATQVVGNVSEKVKKFGVRELEVYVKGVGSGREASIRALNNNGFELVLIKDRTPIPHNGCRSKKPRRV